MDDVVIRLADAADIEALASLRWRAAPPHSEIGTAAADPAGFQEDLKAWLTAHQDVSHCVVADVGGELVGMATLAIVDRPPNPGDGARRSGDVQSVFVVPHRRGQEIGRQLMVGLFEIARDLGISRISLHSSSSAIGFYERLGYETSERLLQIDVPHPKG